MKRAVVAGLAALLAGCTVGPNYQRPPLDVPQSFRNPEQPQAAAPAGDAVSIGNEKWWTVFQDAELQKLIRTALEKNYDVRIAATRILQAQAQVGIARSQEFPQISGVAGELGQKITVFGFTAFELQGALSWSPDFWGQYRRGTEAARASLLGAEWNRKLVMTHGGPRRRLRLFRA